MKLNLIQFGLGNWGKNHNRILKAMGHDLMAYDIHSKWWEVLDNVKKGLTVDGVIITTSSVNHWPIGKMCMELGIPVFIEKPVLLKREQLAELKALAGKKLMMAGHQLVFMPEIAELRGQVAYMNSERSGAIPRTEGSLFSLMVHDIALAHYTTGAERFTCAWAEGNRHEIKATLKAPNGIVVDLHAVSVSKVRLRHTTLITRQQVVHLNPNNWGRVDLLEREMKVFCAYAEQKHPIEINGAEETIRVMESVFKIEDKLNSGKHK